MKITLTRLITRVERVVEIVRKLSDSFDRTRDESHTCLKTEVEAGLCDTMFSEESLDVEDLWFIGFIGYRIKSKVHIISHFLFTSSMDRILYSQSTPRP
jgi:hypothetical protein